MGKVVRFPQEKVDHFRPVDHSTTAAVLILPVVKIERQPATRGRRRRLIEQLRAEMPPPGD